MNIPEQLHSRIVDCAFNARDRHSGQWSALYMLACFEYEEWTREDVEAMIAEGRQCIDVTALEELLSDVSVVFH